LFGNKAEHHAITEEDETMAFVPKKRTWFLRLYRLTTPNEESAFGNRGDWVNMPHNALRIHDTTGCIYANAIIPVDNNHGFEVQDEPEVGVLYSRELHLSFFDHSKGRKIVVKEGGLYYMCHSDHHSGLAPFLQQTIYGNRS
jgi:hypothetical protein